MYQMAGHSTVEDPTLGQAINPAWIKLEWPTRHGHGLVSLPRCRTSAQSRVNLLFLQINSTGGIDTVADSLADILLAIKDMKTVAYIGDRATGVAAMLPLACRDIIFSKTSQMGDVHQTITAINGHLHDLSESQITALAKKADLLAREKGHPEAVAVGHDRPPRPRSWKPRTRNPGPPKLILHSQMDAEPGPVSGDAESQSPRIGPDCHGRGRRSYGLGQVVASDKGHSKAYMDCAAGRSGSMGRAGSTRWSRS